MSDYTRGKWKANGNYFGTWTISTNGAHIADVDRHFNAYLIAAAPTIYESLKGLIDWLDNENELVGDIYKIRSLARQSLLKAEGK